MNTKEIIKEIAKKNGVTPQKVERDMKQAMQFAMQSANPKAQEHWQNIAPDGKEPSLESFLSYCVSRVKQNSIA